MAGAVVLLRGPLKAETVRVVVGAVVVLPALLRGVLLAQGPGGGGAAVGVGAAAPDPAALVDRPVEVSAMHLHLAASQIGVRLVLVGAVVVLPARLRGVLLDQVTGRRRAAVGVGAAALDQAAL